jgi:protein-L-isoaspartate(D-aspartate) O-methyltransferase
MGRFCRVLGLACVLLWAAADAAAQRRDSYQAVRETLVKEYIEAEGISNPRVLEAIRTVPRHEFVRPSLRQFAYYDQALDIGHKQTISPPYIVAYMTEMLDPQPEDRVLEIGTGSGYQAAVLAELVREVYTIEIVAPLGRQAASRLRNLRCHNVQVRIGDGYQGWAEHAPFDKIIVTCSPESVPQPLIDQLRDGGRLIVPLGERYQQVFYLFEKRDGELVQTRLQPTLFVPMTGRSEELRTVHPDSSSPQIRNAGFESVDPEHGRLLHWHYQRRSTVMADAPPEGARYVCFENDQPGRTSHVLQGLSLDGQRIRKLMVSLQYRTRGVRTGSNPAERPALLLHFYDEERLPLGHATVGPWLDDTDSWTPVTHTISIPSRCREAILQVGLNGSVGTLCVDDLRLDPPKIAAP